MSLSHFVHQILSILGELDAGIPKVELCLLMTSRFDNKEGFAGFGKYP